MSVKTVKIKQGDVVRVKSGGKLMTVLSISGDTAECAFEDVERRFVKISYPLIVLSKIRSNKTSEIKQGDVVSVKSGGKLMTVLSISGDTAKCVFDVGDGKLKDIEYPLITLKIDNRDPDEF